MDHRDWYFTSSISWKTMPDTYVPQVVSVIYILEDVLYTLLMLLFESLCRYSNNLIFSVERLGWKGICQVLSLHSNSQSDPSLPAEYAPAVGWNLITLLFDSRTLYIAQLKTQMIFIRKGEQVGISSYHHQPNKIVRWVWEIFTAPEAQIFTLRHTWWRGAAPFIHSLHLWQPR